VDADDGAVVPVGRDGGGVGRDEAGDADEQAATRMHERGTSTETRRRIDPV
jgi:hypothetical protein